MCIRDRTKKPAGADDAPADGVAKDGAAKDGAAKDDAANKDAAANGPEATAGEPDSPVHPALGDPAEVAKTLVAAAKAGEDVVRVVSGDPLTTDSVLGEVNAVARTSIAFEVLPGLPAASVVPSYAGMPLGSTHTEADVRGEVDWAALALSLIHISEPTRPY